MNAPGFPRRLAIQLGIVQFFAALSWIAYVAYLPRMATSAGIPAAAVGWILLIDQTVFAVSDLYFGEAADRALRVMERIGLILVSVTVVSGAAFIALPVVAVAAGASPSGWKPLFFVLLLVWAITSSVLRAPALALVAKRTPKPSLPWLAALFTIGNALAAAAAPYLAHAAENHDPRWAFLLSTCTLVAAVAGLAAAERSGTKSPERKVAIEAANNVLPALLPERGAVERFFVAAGLLAFGYQVHANLNAAVLYRQFVAAAELPSLLPIFWIGFNLIALLGAWHAKRFGAVATLAGAALLGAVSSAGAVVAPGVGALACAQFLTGGAWGAIMAVLFAHALALGKPGREGRMAGRLSALLAVAAVVRLGMGNLGLPSVSAFTQLLPWLPPALWLLAAALLWRRATSTAA